MPLAKMYSAQVETDQPLLGGQGLLFVSYSQNTGEDQTNDQTANLVQVSPQVVGVAAYFLSLNEPHLTRGPGNIGRMASIIKAEIEELAYPRKQLKGAAPVSMVWNGWEPPGNTLRGLF